MSQQLISRDEHVFICGANGTGKTELGKIYLAGYKNVVVLDTKQKFDWYPWLIEGDDYILVRDINDLYNITKYDKIVYRPNIHQMNPTYYDQFFEWCFKRQNTIIMIDEAMHVCDAHKIPFWYRTCLTSGRESNVSCWNVSQRPSNVSNFTMTESVHWFVFRLNSIDDRMKVVKNSGDDVFKNPTKGHYFIYKNMNNEGHAVRILDI